MTTSLGVIRVDVSDVVRVEGEVDAHTADLLVEAVRRLPPGHRHVDASDVRFAGAAALSALLQICRECDAMGDTLSIAPSRELRRLVHLAGLESVLPLV